MIEQNYINHIAFVIDRSGSIANAGLSQSVVDVFNSQIERLSKTSKKLEQPTRVSVYLFNEEVECLCYDVDIDKVPNLAKYYKANGSTAMIDATLQAINDLSKTNTLYGDHAFLVYALTDGENNIHNNLASRLNKTISRLGENWTVAALVPDKDGINSCEKFGFPADNIKIWDVSKKGLSVISSVMSDATDSYMLGRTKGIRGTRNLFSLNAANLNTKTVKRNLNELDTFEYDLIPVYQTSAIRDYVEKYTKSRYRVGSAYYLISKPETIQASKQIALYEKQTGKIYTGINARKMLGLPDFEIKVNPVNWGQFDIYIQSTSTNRKLVKGTKLLLLK